MATVVGLSIIPNHDVPGTKNDLHLDDTGNLAMVYDAEAVGQHARQRLLFWRGEWFLNEEAGIDWLRYVLGRQPSEQPIAEAVIKREIAATPGVAEIVEFDAIYDRASRGLRMDRVTIASVFDEGYAYEILPGPATPDLTPGPVTPGPIPGPVTPDLTPILPSFDFSLSENSSYLLLLDDI